MIKKAADDMIDEIIYIFDGVFDNEGDENE